MQQSRKKRQLTSEDLHLSEERWKKIQHYSEEVLIFLVYATAIVCSTAIEKKTSGRRIVAGDIFTGWPDLLLSLFLAIVSYVAVNKDSIRYGSGRRPVLGKRVLDAALKGLAWRQVVSILS